MNFALLWPSAVWSALGSLVPLAAPHARRLLAQHRSSWVGPAALLGPWIHGPGLAFAALFTGSLPARALGLFGSDGRIGWVGGGLLVLLLWLGARRALERRPVALGLDRYDVVVLDEPRWALYRGAGWLWTGSFYLGGLVGIGLGLVEWALTWRAWRPNERATAPACFMLARIGVSALAFSLTGNLWLTAVLQVGLAVLIDEGSS